MIENNFQILYYRKVKNIAFNNIFDTAGMISYNKNGIQLQ